MRGISLSLRYNNQFIRETALLIIESLIKIVQRAQVSAMILATYLTVGGSFRCK